MAGQVWFTPHLLHASTYILQLPCWMSYRLILICNMFFLIYFMAARPHYAFFMEAGYLVRGVDEEDLLHIGRRGLWLNC